MGGASHQEERTVETEWQDLNNWPGPYNGPQLYEFWPDVSPRTDGFKGTCIEDNLAGGIYRFEFHKSPTNELVPLWQPDDVIRVMPSRMLLQVTRVGTWTSGELVYTLTPRLDYSATEVL